MIIKGKSVGGAGRLAVHLMRTDTNERAEVKELRGVAAEDLRGALLEMEAVASGTRTAKPFYHGSINTLAEDRLTDDQRMYAIDRMEAALGLTGQARIVVVHEKEGREHCHIVWSRVDLDTMKVVSDSFNYRKHEEVARALEREFGHERVQGAHAERDGKERPERTPSHAEMLQAERTGLSPKEVRAQITALWQRTGSGQEFAVALWEAGYVLARGDRRDYVVIDPRGGTHSLARRVEGAKVKDIRDRMADIDPTRLYSIADAKQIQRARQERDAARANERAEGQQGIRQEAARGTPEADQGRSRGTPEGPAGTGRAAEGIGRVAASMLDGLANIFERGLSGDESQADQARQEPPPDPRETQRTEAARSSEDDQSKQRQERLREFGREIENEQEAELERGRQRQRGE